MNVESGIMLGKAMAKPSRKLAWIEDVIGYRTANAVQMMKEDHSQFSDADRRV